MLYKCKGQSMARDDWASRRDRVLRRLQSLWSNCCLWTRSWRTVLHLVRKLSFNRCLIELPRATTFHPYQVIRVSYLFVQIWLCSLAFSAFLVRPRWGPFRWSVGCYFALNRHLILMTHLARCYRGRKQIFVRLQQQALTHFHHFGGDSAIHSLNYQLKFY